MLRPLIVISLVSGATAALAEPVPLTGDALRGLGGSRVELDTPLGTKLPILFGADGLVSGEAGDLAPILGSKKDRGRWWVEGDKLCSKWFRWFDAEVRCITVSRDGTRLFWKKDDGETGTATLIEAVEQPPKVEVAVAAPVEKPVPVASAETVVSAPIETAALIPEDIPPPVRKKLFVTASVTAPTATLAPPTTVTTLPVEPTIIARAEPVAAPEISDQPMMRFGGAGLLEASARMGLENGTAASSVTDPSKLAKAAARTVPKAAGAASLAAGSAAGALPKPQKKAVAVAVNKSAKPAKPAAKDRVASRAEPRMTYKVRGVDEDDVLNVRRGPSEQHPLVASIPASGRRVEMTGRCEKDWCPVRYGAVTGWVHSYYLAEEHPRQASSSAVYFAKP